MVAGRRQHRALSGWVQGDAGVTSRVMERDARSVRSGGLVDVDLARSGHGAR
jgi:hypothetical protein